MAVNHMKGKNKAVTPQPDPVQNEQPPIVAMVAKDLFDRAEFGRQKYGTYLQPGNGRDSLWDAYQEALDLVCYLRNEIEERSRRR